MKSRILIAVSFGSALFVLGFIPHAFASASNIYIAQTAAGSADGTDCADAYAYTFFNTASNWGSGSSQIGPGTTVHLCGTITVPLNNSGLIVHGAARASVRSRSSSSPMPFCNLLPSMAALTVQWAGHSAQAEASRSTVTTISSWTAGRTGLSRTRPTEPVGKSPVQLGR